MQASRLFLGTVSDLEAKIGSSDDYEILQCSALIRKLLLDGDRLVDRANRPYGIKLEFEIVDTQKLLGTFDIPGMPSLEFFGVGDGLDPDSLPNPPRKIVSRDNFLATVVQLSNGHGFTVRDLIKFQANIAGGVHLSEPKTDRDAALSSTEDSLQIGGIAPGLRQLKAIGRVTLRAIAPLRVAILSSKAINVDLKNVEAHYNRGVLFAQAGKMSEAIADFDATIAYGSEHPRIADAYYNRGYVRHRMALPDLAADKHADLDGAPSETTLDLLRLACADYEAYLEKAPASPEKETIANSVTKLRAVLDLSKS